MTFNDFLNALMRLSVQLYEAPSVDASFEALLMENVLPFAKRRVGIRLMYPLHLHKS